MSEHESSVEEITHIEEHLNETMLKIFDHRHFDYSDKKLVNLIKEEMHINKNKELMSIENNQASHSCNQPLSSNALCTNKYCVSNCYSSLKLAKTGIYNNKFSMPSKPDFYEYANGSNLSPQLLLSNVSQYERNKNSNSSANYPTFYTSDYSSGQAFAQSNYESPPKSQLYSSFSIQPNNSMYRLKNSNYQLQYTSTPFGMQCHISPFNSHKQNNYNLTFSQISMEKVDNPKFLNINKLSKTSSAHGDMNHNASKYNYDKMTLEELIKAIPTACKDQFGCRLLQNKIDQTPKFAEFYVFPKIKNQLEDLMTHKFGNYLIQKLIDKLPFQLLNSVSSAVSKHISY